LCTSPLTLSDHAHPEHLKLHAPRSGARKCGGEVIKMDLPVDFVDAKPFWSALYHSLTFANAEGYEYRTSSIFRVPARCNGLIKRSKRLNLKDLVAREGVEPPTPAFSGLDSLSLSPFSINNLIRQVAPVL